MSTFRVSIEVTVPLIYKGLLYLAPILAFLLPLSWILLTYERESSDKPGAPGGNTSTEGTQQ